MGAGTFVNCYRRYVEAKQYCQRPFDKFKQNNEIKTFRSKEKIQAQFVPRFEDLKAADHGVLLHCGDSAHLSFIPDESVDAVITDPPYFDNIHYSELSNFFYVWLRLFQPSQYFASDHVSTEQEAIVNVGMNKTDEDYQRLITSVFSECARVLKDSGSMMFTFHHSKPRAWWVILQAIVNSGFIVVDYFPVTSEYKVNPHVRDKAAIDKDLVIICEKQKLHQSDDFKLSFDLVSDRASKRIASLYDHQSGSENFCFYYIGEMLLIGSQSVNIRLDVFENIFSQAEKFKDKIKSSYHNEANDIKLSEYADLPLFAGLIRK